MFTKMRATLGGGLPPRAPRGDIAARALAASAPLARAPRALLDALATPHGVDRYLEWLRPTWTLDEARATVTRVERPTRDCVRLGLRPSRRFAGFAAGQSVELGVEVDGVRQVRCYSPAGSAHRPGELELTVKRHPHGRVSRWLYERARPGQVLELGPARGDFVLPEPRPERLLLVSGGSGITPVLSILRTLCDEGHAGPVTFLHYARRPGALPYAEELAALEAAHPKLRVLRVYSETPEAGDLRGRFSREQLRAAEPAYAAAETFVCGPEGLMEAVGALFAEEGLDERLHAESFVPLRYAVRPDAAGGRIRFERSGLELESDGRSLLEQAEAAGLAPAYGCRRGICFTCVRRMTAGSLRHVTSGDPFTGTEVDVRLCVHAPAGDVHLDL